MFWQLVKHFQGPEQRPLNLGLHEETPIRSGATTDAGGREVTFSTLFKPLPENSAVHQPQSRPERSALRDCPESCQVARCSFSPTTGHLSEKGAAAPAATTARHGTGKTMIMAVEPTRIEDLKNAGATSHSVPHWMRNVLLAAAAYNLLWGAFAILTPLTIFRWAGFDPLPSYPQLWQCVGMIVGVYGIGYAIAATNPYRHWPIVLVGLLGKVFGPIGFVGAVTSGSFPLSMGWTILTNDLIWWVPFALILWNAAVANQSQSDLLVVPPVRLKPDPFQRFISQRGASLSELSRSQPTLVVLLRHSGCTFCRETLGDLSELREQIEAKGTRIALIHMGAEEPVDLLKKYGLEDVHCFRDATGQL